MNPNPDANPAFLLPNPRWNEYYSATPDETPPLPPSKYNDKAPADTAHQTNCTHHLIRDFMFLDAVKNNDVNSRSDSTPAPIGDFPYSVVRIDLDTSEGEVATYTQGAGDHSCSYYLLLDDPALDPADKTSDLQFESRQIAFTALLYELRDGESAAQVVPNWFGVAVPDGITDFRNVIIYFHPSPGQAGYDKDEYWFKSDPPGTHTYTGTNWRELYAYVERLGKQVDGAAKYSSDALNQIVILPFMQQYDDVGVFPQYWYFIVKSILDDLYNNGPKANKPVPCVNTGEL